MLQSMWRRATKRLWLPLSCGRGGWGVRSGGHPLFARTPALHQPFRLLQRGDERAHELRRRRAIHDAVIAGNGDPRARTR